MSSVTSPLAPLTAFCDGSALGNPGPGGFAWWISDDCWHAAGFASPVTNNAMELLALAHLLRSVPSHQPLVVRMDSQYAIDCVSKWAFGWRKNGWTKRDGKPIANLDVIREIFDARAGRDVRLEWVRGHAGHAGNEIVDAKARGCAERARASRSDVAFGPGWPQP